MILTHNFDNWDEMVQLPEIHKLSKFAWEEIDDQNGPISIKQIESINNNFSNKKGPHPEIFTYEYWQRFKWKKVPTIHTLFQKKEVRRIFLKSFHETSISYIPKLHKVITGKENNRLITFMYIGAKVLKKLW